MKIIVNFLFSFLAANLSKDINWNNCRNHS